MKIVGREQSICVVSINCWLNFNNGITYLVNRIPLYICCEVMQIFQILNYASDN